MADKKISAMTAASALGGAELIAGVQSGGNVKITATQIATYVLTQFANTDFSGLPTSDPGGGKPWLNSGFLMIGAA